MRKLRDVLILLLPALVLMPVAASAQNGRPQVIRDDHHDTSPPLRELPPGPRRIGELEAERPKHIPSNRIPFTGRDAVLQGAPAGPVTLAAPTTSANFEGVGQGFTGPAGTFTVNS